MDTVGTTILVTTLAVLLLERAAELVINHRHVAALRERGATFHKPDGFQLILIVQVLLFLLVPLEALFAPWSGVWSLTWYFLGVLVGAQILRYWVIRTLGDRWSIHVITLPGKHRILTGPYRWLRHPNYLAVGLETLALPLAFAAPASLVLVGSLQIFALRNRIRHEERAMASAVQTA